VGGAEVTEPAAAAAAMGRPGTAGSAAVPRSGSPPPSVATINQVKDTTTTTVNIPSDHPPA
jgi:hypothetical protein